MNSVERFIWPGKKAYDYTDRIPLLDPKTKQIESFVKAHGAFKYYWILHSGHSVSIASRAYIYYSQEIREVTGQSYGVQVTDRLSCDR